MTKYLWIILLAIIIGGCKRNEPINLKSIIGEYYGIENSKDYNHLELREDNTFHFDQSKMYSCDIWGHFYGYFRIENNKLKLYQGSDLKEIIDVNSTKGADDDTLRITFSKSFLKEFPDLKVRIGHDSIDTKIVNRKIIFNKYDYCIGEKVFVKYDNDKMTTYDSYPVELNIRDGAYYHMFNYILGMSELSYSLGGYESKVLEKELLIEYRLVNGIMESTKCTNWIDSHKLTKVKRK